MQRNTIVVIILLLLFAFVTVDARAATVAETTNKAGGKIILTDRKCTTISNTMIAYSTMPDGRTTMGCWTADENFVHVIWSDGDHRAYPFSGWTVHDKK